MEQGPKIEYELPKEATPKKYSEELGPNPDQAPKRTVFTMMLEAKAEFPQEIQALIEKRQAKKPFSPSEQSQFDKVRDKWWRDMFGAPLWQRYWGLPEKEFKRKNLQSQKQELMAQLHVDLRNLDKGERVERFQEMERRVIHFDKNKNKYFILVYSGPRYLGIGDILSDYAWGIEYAPDEKMPPQVLRQLAKRIIINETRRKIEGLDNKNFPKQIGSLDRGSFGFIAEAMARELLSRLSFEENSGFVVLRANSLEDNIYKYDFKLRFLQRLRGVAVEENKESLQRNLKTIKKLGIQFTLQSHHLGKKKSLIGVAKKNYGEDMPVDDIVFVQVPGRQFRKAFGKWLVGGKPSGGPEQFLSQELKDDLLEKTTAGLRKTSAG